MDATMGLSLPSAPKKVNKVFFDYTTLIYGRPGIGKTTWMASFPDAILFSCERVSKGIPCYDFNTENGGGGVHSWEVFKAGVALLEKSDKFQTVCIDTIQAAYGQCMTWVCKQNHIAHPGDEGFGKGWAAVRDEFASMLDTIAATGRGIVFASHAKDVEITSHSGEKYTRIQPSLSGQAYDYIKQKSDFVFYAEYVKDAEGEPRRVLFTTGDEVIDAKHAGILPKYIILDKDREVDTVARAFAGEVGLGVDPELIRPDKNTSSSGTAALRKDRANKALEKVKGAVGKPSKKKVLKRRA